MSHVARQVATARRHGTATKRTRVPAPRFPTLIEADYAHRIVGLVHSWRHAAGQLVTALPTLLRRDAAGDDANRILGRVRNATTHASNDTALASLAGDFGGRVANHQKADVLRQAKAALGVDLALHDPRLAGALQQFIHENVVLIRNLHGRTLDSLEALIHRGISTGMSHEEIGELISKRFDVSERHARLIARDQVAKLNSNVTELRHAEIGIREFDWWTMLDTRVRPRHRSLHGQRFAYHDPPAIGLPGHEIMCFPGETQIDSLSPVVRIYRRRYSGPGVVITTNNRSLSSTPNHPILTDRGWIPAHAVDVGDHVVEAADQVRDALVSNGKGRYPSMGEVFDAFSPLGGSRILGRVGASGSWFHGDASSDQDVDVVDVDRCLGLELNPEISQVFCQKLLSKADLLLPGVGGLDLVFGGMWNSTHGVMRGGGKLLADLLGGGGKLLADLLGGGSHTNEHRLRAISWLHSTANELATNGHPWDSEVLRQALDAPTLTVQRHHQVARIVLGVMRRAVDDSTGRNPHSAEELAEVVAGRPESLGGLSERHGLHHLSRVVEKVGCVLDSHVFNLETRSSWYIANGIAVNNCRCIQKPVWSSVLADVSAQAWVPAGALGEATRIGVGMRVPG